MKAFFVFLCTGFLLFHCSSSEESYSSNSYNTYYNKLYNYSYYTTSKNPISDFPVLVGDKAFLELKLMSERDQIPYTSSIATEELINSIPYHYDFEEEGGPLQVYTETSASPFDKKKVVSLIALKTKSKNVVEVKIPPRNLVIVADTSGSMSGDLRIGLLKKTLKDLSHTLNEKDVFSLISFESEAKILIKELNGKESMVLQKSIAALEANGGTNAWPAIQLAYKIARSLHEPNQYTKIIFATDGDFGGVNEKEFYTLIAKEKKAGIEFSVLGYGVESNNKVMDTLIEKGLATCNYIQTETIARSSLFKEVLSPYSLSLKDLKVSLEFNPKLVKLHRLIGFEKNYVYKKPVPNELPGDYTVSTFYEMLIDETSTEKELFKIKLNYMENNGNLGSIQKNVYKDTNSAFDKSADFRFALGVAGFGMFLNRYPITDAVDYNLVIHLMQDALDYDPQSYRSELFKIVLKYRNMQ
ncbi:MAG: von Willebrand factor type A domain-containing protein [Leptospiraceae bacterium]|nr:von Willebrand factor type A domain-containing protein [Leptospiraceae bacterium]